MIYEFPDIDKPIVQGDIFIGLPRVDFSIREISMFDATGQAVTGSWSRIVRDGEEIASVVPVKPVTGIVITQDCDTATNHQITFCEIKRFSDVEVNAASITSPTRWVEHFLKESRRNRKWFYLPPNPALNFDEKMGVDFRETLQVNKNELEQFMELRKGRLIRVAKEHFRERISDFFRSYPYDEWYSLNQQEFDFYQTKHHDAEPFPWQVSNP